MIPLENTLISDYLKDIFFCCDLPACKGACCIEGDAGAPLEEEEITILEDHLDRIRPFMSKNGIEAVEESGVFEYDESGEIVTPLVKGGECAYVYFEKGIARCAIEKAFEEKAIPFPKPISCHLYPVRIKKARDNELVNYHKWPICNSALVKGLEEKLPLYRFLESSLTRKYGRSWYNQLVRLLQK